LFVAEEVMMKHSCVRAAEEVHFTWMSRHPTVRRLLRRSVATSPAPLLSIQRLECVRARHFRHRVNVFGASAGDDGVPAAPRNIGVAVQAKPRRVTRRPHRREEVDQLLL
jgi:hypothetical protein